MVQLRYPDGVRGDNFIPVTIDGYDYELRFFTDREPDRIAFNLYVKDAEYARQSIVLRFNGEFYEDSEEVIPKVDLTDHEPKRPSRPFDILQSVIEALNKQQ
jgi:hypothetical protein